MTGLCSWLKGRRTKAACDKSLTVSQEMRLLVKHQCSDKYTLFDILLHYLHGEHFHPIRPGGV